MKLSLSGKFILATMFVYAAAAYIFLLWNDRTAMESVLNAKMSDYSRIARALDEVIGDPSQLSRDDMATARAMDIVVGGHNNARIMITDLEGIVAYDSSHMQTGLTLAGRDLLRISTKNPDEKFFLVTPAGLHDRFLPITPGPRPLVNYRDARLILFSPLYRGGKLTGQIIFMDSLNDAARDVSAFRNNLLLLLGLGFVIVSLLILIVTRRLVTIPLGQLTRLTRKVGARDFSERIEFSGNDEIGALGRAFSTMEYHLQNFKDETERELAELRERNEGLIHLSSEFEQKLQDMQRRQKLIDFDLRLAHNIQQELLPQNYPKIEGLMISAANFQMEEIGGDCFDFYKLGDTRLGAFIGDVSGKGISAALVMAMVTILFSQLKDTSPTPSKILGTVNEIMYRHFGSQHSIYLTCFFLTADLTTMTVTYSCAGHNPPILFRPRTGAVTALEAEGFGLGMFPTINYEEKRFEVQPGDKIVLYTDGVVDCRNSEGKMFGYERMLETIRNYPDVNCYRLTHLLVEELEEFAERANRTDDLTIIVIEITNPKESMTENA